MIVPPFNVEGLETDKDSGEENRIDPNYLNKNQLFSNTHIELNTSHVNVWVGVTDFPVNELTKQNNDENRKKNKKPKLVCHQTLHLLPSESTRKYEYSTHFSILKR